MVKSVLSLSNELPNIKRNDFITKENKNGKKLLYEQSTTVTTQTLHIQKQLSYLNNFFPLKIALNMITKVEAVAPKSIVWESFLPSLSVVFMKNKLLIK